MTDGTTQSNDTADDEPVSKQVHLRNRVKIEGTKPDYRGSIRITEHNCGASDPTGLDEIFGLAETQAELFLETPHLTASAELTPRTTRQVAHMLADCAGDACHVEPLPTPERISQLPHLSTTETPSSDENNQPPQLQTTAYPDRVRVELDTAEAAHVIDYSPTAARAFARQLLEAAGDADSADDYEPEQTGHLELTKASEPPSS